MSEPEFFAPWRIVGAFGDGARLTFDGLTEQQAIDAMDAAQAQHGDIIWWDRVTDVNYEDASHPGTRWRANSSILGTSPSSSTILRRVSSGFILCSMTGASMI